MMDKAMVIGADSKLGVALYDRLSAEKGVSVVGTSRRRSSAHELTADLAQPRLLPLGRYPGYVVYVVAAVTGIVACEADPSSWVVNADAPVEFARRAASCGSRVIFVSSDAVEVAPHTVYARQKSYAELGVLAHGGSVFRPARMAIPAHYQAAAEQLLIMGQHDARGVMRWRYSA